MVSTSCLSKMHYVLLGFLSAARTILYMHSCALLVASTAHAVDQAVAYYRSFLWYAFLTKTSPKGKLPSHVKAWPNSHDDYLHDFALPTLLQMCSRGNIFYKVKQSSRCLNKIWYTRIVSSNRSRKMGPLKGFNRELIDALRGRFHFHLTSISLPSHFNFTSISRRVHFDLTLISLRSHFEFTSISLWSHFDFTLISLRFHFDLTSISLWHHFDLT